MTKFNKDFKNGPCKKKIFKILKNNNNIKKTEIRDTSVLKYQGNRRNQKGRLVHEKRTETEGWRSGARETKRSKSLYGVGSGVLSWLKTQHSKNY